MAIAEPIQQRGHTEPVSRRHRDRCGERGELDTNDDDQPIQLSGFVRRDMVLQPDDGGDRVKLGAGDAADEPIPDAEAEGLSGTDDEEHSTPYTLLDLDYDMWDVVERLKELTVSEYSETKIDKDDLNPPLLFVFGKEINKKLVYVKLKIKGDQKRRVLCVSFHYARDPMKFPYA